MADSATMATPSTDLFKYDEHEDVYMCRKCLTHITLHRQLLRKYADNNKHCLLFEDMINIDGDLDKFLTNKKTTVRSVYCTKCAADLGFKFIELEEPKDDIEEGRFLAYADKLLLWKGKQILDAVTEEPVEQN